MKKLLFILTLLALLSCKKENENPKYEWTDVSPESETYFRDIQMLNDNVGYVAGTISNEPTDLTCTQNLTGVTCQISLDNTIPDLSCIVTDPLPSASIMYKTEDGGKSWNQVTLPFSKYKHMSFVDEHLGFVLSGDGLYKTTDGGQNWQKIMENSVIYDHTIKSNTFQKVKFTGPDNGFLYTNYFMGGSCILVSVNGDGAVKKVISNPVQIPAPISFVNGIERNPVHPEEVFILTSKNLFMSNADGDNPEQIPNTYPYEKITYTGKSWYALHAKILSKSNPEGKIWNNISTLPLSYCSILTSAGEDWICVSDKTGIYLSEDGGLKFRQMSKPGVEINEICFPSPKTGIAVGPNGRILRYSSAE